MPFVKSQSQDPTEFQKYKLNQSKYQNIRIGALLEPRGHNSDLLKYLDDKNSYDTASFGESTSADELVFKAQSSSGEVEIFRQSPVTKQIDEAR